MTKGIILKTMPSIIDLSTNQKDCRMVLGNYNNASIFL